MRRWRRCAAMLVVATGLAGCARGDSQAKFLPDFMRDKAPTPQATDPQPDVKTLVRERRQEMFVGAIDAVLVGPPHRKGTHWMFCARPSGRGAGGQPLAAQTYLIEIDGTIIGDRLPVDGAHWCAHEAYEPS